jgi:hypothetical protein
MKAISHLLLACAAVLLGGCATHITTDQTWNPPPDEKLSAFTAFDLRPVRLAPAFVDKAANQKALLKIQDNVNVKMFPLLKRWNADGESAATKRTLVIEPVIREIKFINATARVWAGPMAGSSAVILDATLTDAATGKVIARPTFYARAEAWGGAATFGSTDNLMLARIANRFTDYLESNYRRAIGGPTGAEPKN